MRLVLLGCAVLAGTCAALVASRNSEIALPPDVAVLVAGRAISREEIGRAWAAVDADRSIPGDDAARAFALRRVVEEEMLVQAAIESDRLRRDDRLRRATLRVMLDLESQDDPLAAVPSGASDRAAAFDTRMRQLRATATIRELQ